jgi:type IV secretory pathway VirB3-like protein
LAVSGVLDTGLLATGSVSIVFLTLVNILVQAFSSVLFAVAIAVVYHDLRIAKEGANVDEIAAVFD